MVSKFRASLSSFLDRIMARLTITETTLAEFQSSTTLIFFGVVFLNPWPTLSRLPVYNSMLALLPEWAWGVVCLSTGLAQSVANARRSPMGRKLCAFSTSVLFGFFTILLGMASSSSVSDSPFWGVPTYPVIPCLAVSSLVQGLVYLRLSIRADARAREEARLGIA